MLNRTFQETVNKVEPICVKQKPPFSPGEKHWRVAWLLRLECKHMKRTCSRALSVQPPIYSAWPGFDLKRNEASLRALELASKRGKKQQPCCVFAEVPPAFFPHVFRFWPVRELRFIHLSHGGQSLGGAPSSYWKQRACTVPFPPCKSQLQRF